MQRKLYILLILLVCGLWGIPRAAAQELAVTVIDGGGGDDGRLKDAPLPLTSLLLKGPGGQTVAAMTDDEGHATLSGLAAGHWSLTASMVGYGSQTLELEIPRQHVARLTLMPTDSQLREVVVTAKESKGPTSASLIDRQAMAHLQPSSFSELLELVPGNISVDPNPGAVNTIQLRQAANASDDQNYATSSLGTSFVVDGVPMNTSADMQSSLDSSRGDRSAVGRGVDMRQLSTDDIEKVEIVRGIASVEYGEMTSGLVNIKRKQGATRLEARFKADSKSQLFYVGKGFAYSGDDRGSMNLSVDYLDSKVDPRNNRENFKRITASARSLLKWKYGWGLTSWQSSLSYAGMRELDNNDPDLTINGTVDYYRSHQDELTFNNTLNFSLPTHPFVRNVTLTQGLTYGYSKTHQEKTIAPSRIYPLAISTTPGDHYVDFMPMLYEAQLDVIGKPLTAFVKAAGQGNWQLWGSENRLKAGLEWTLSKNYGAGQVYDTSRPIVAGNNRRPRAFSDIPAMQQASGYVENVSNFAAGNHRFELQLGLRYTQLLHIDKQYALSGKPYFDPRANVQWTLPRWMAGDQPMELELAGGVGWMTKMPVAAYLYPDLLYTDHAQLNYYHNDPAYRVMNVRTFVEDLTNYDLLAARNLKWEARTDLSWWGNRLSVTYFRENMKGGFRQSPFVSIYNYVQYDASGYDPYLEGRAPTIADLPGTAVTKLSTPSRWTNGSRTYKQGVEFTFSSRRFPVVRTRATVTGAWLRTTLNNSQPLWYHPSVILNGAELPYAGLYADTDGQIFESFNTNFTFDTDVPRLGLNFSLAIQNMWYTSSQVLRRATTPISYMDANGDIHPFTEACLDDPYLSQLVRQWSEAAFDKRRVPIATMFNIKATKSLWQKRINIALYVNRLVSITPDYYQYGALQRRYTSPYFGMEINLKL